jgi:hypothetical protein
MLKPSFQRWIGKIRSMEFKLIPSGSGPQGPGQFRMILRYKPQATSAKLQAPSFKLSGRHNLRLKKNKKRFDKPQAAWY